MNPDIHKKIEQHFAASPVRTFPKGAVITHAGEEPVGVSLLVSGTVEQYDITSEGNKVTLNLFRPPAFFPMAWAINRAPNEYFFAAHSDVMLRNADADGTVAFLQANPDVMFDLLSRVYRGTDALLRRRVITLSGITSNRLIFELLIEAYRFGRDVSGDAKLISVRQRTLAARSGLARETVSRELHKLEREHLIRLTKDGIELECGLLEARLNDAV